MESIKGIPEGVGRFFERTYRSAKTGLQKVDDVRHGRAPGLAEIAPPSQLPGAPRTPAAAPTESLSTVAARAAGNTALNTLGFDEDRRRLAKELAVDPYTTNPVLSAKLDEVTWAAFAGNLGVDLLTSMIPGGMIVSTSSRLTDWVWDTPPGDLRLEIEATLRSIGVGQEEIDRFLRHRWYPLSLQAALAASLAALDGAEGVDGGVDGRAEVIALALGVGSEGQARFVVQTLAMLARHHKTVEPLATLAVGGTVYGETKDGALVVMAPVDYLSWTPLAKTFAERKGELGSARTLHIAGRATGRARDALQDLGWKVEEESPLFVPLLATSAEAQ